MIINTGEGKTIFFDRLEDLRGYIDDNILDALEIHINNEIAKALDNKYIEDYKAEIDDLKYEVRDLEDKRRGVLNSVLSAIETLCELRDDLE